MPPIYAGAARVKLDPPAGLAMLGYGNRIGRNAGVHDDLAAQALVLSETAGSSVDFAATLHSLSRFAAVVRIVPIRHGAEICDCDGGTAIASALGLPV